MRDGACRCPHPRGDGLGFSNNQIGAGGRRPAGRVRVFPGGVPLKIGDEVVGAVGVSGGVNKQDQAVAEAAAEAFAAVASKRAA